MSVTEGNTLAAALEYASRGWRVFPLWPGGKVPLIQEWQHRATTDEATIRAWWARWPNANVAIATGAGSGLVVLDVDGPKGEATLARLEAANGALPPTREVKTPRGRHLYFDHPGGYVPCSAGLVGPGLDVRGDGGYVVAPPSVERGGHVG